MKTYKPLASLLCISVLAAAPVAAGLAPLFRERLLARLVERRAISKVLVGGVGSSGRIRTENQPSTPDDSNLLDPEAGKPPRAPHPR